MIQKLIFIFAFASGGCAQLLTINDMPNFKSNDAVDIYYCETGLPYNAPPSIVKAAGSTFSEYSTTYAGLGIWDTTTNEKLTIQFVANNYIGSLLPELTPAATGSGYIFWNNSGSVVVNYPLEEDSWTNSRHISSTSGVAYSDLVNYLQQNPNKFSVYQPVTVVSPTAAIVDENSSAYSGNTVNGLGIVRLQPTNSYSFVTDLISSLAGFGVDLSAFLNVYTNQFSYLASNETDNLQEISWPAGSVAPEQVYTWFDNLKKCYEEKFDATVAVNGGAQYFLEMVTLCYGSHAFVYASPSSVYNVSLMHFSSYSSPVVYRSIYNLPPTPDENDEALAVMDYIIIVIFLLVVVFGIFYVIRMFWSRKQRRRVSFEGERIAEKAVANAAETDDDAINNYYTSRGDSYSRGIQAESSRNSVLNSILNFSNGSSSSSSDLRTQLTNNSLYTAMIVVLCLRLLSPGANDSTSDLDTQTATPARCRFATCHV